MLDHQYSRFLRPEHRGVALRRRAREAGDANRRATTGSTTASPVRASSVRARCRSATTSASTRSCGDRTTRTPKARTRTPPRRCATPSPVSTSPRSRRWSGSPPPTCTASTSTCSSRWRREVGPTVDEVAVPLDRGARRLALDRVRGRRPQALVSRRIASRLRSVANLWPSIPPGATHGHKNLADAGVHTRGQNRPMPLIGVEHLIFAGARR